MVVVVIKRDQRSGRSSPWTGMMPSAAFPRKAERRPPGARAWASGSESWCSQHVAPGPAHWETRSPGAGLACVPGGRSAGACWWEGAPSACHCSNPRSESHSHGPGRGPRSHQQTEAPEGRRENKEGTTDSGDREMRRGVELPPGQEGTSWESHLG